MTDTFRRHYASIETVSLQKALWAKPAMEAFALCIYGLDMKAAIQCRCGTIEGHLSVNSAKPPRHIVCYCDDCQAFSNAVKGEDTLDAHGGSNILQTTPNKLVIDKGKEQLACLRLSPKGALRWYAGCCNTPVANTVSGKFPFVGVYRHMVSSDFDAGPVKYRVMGKYAHDAPSTLDIHPGFPPKLVARIVLRVVIDKIKGAHKPSTFFNSAGIPVSKPKILKPS